VKVGVVDVWVFFQLCFGIVQGAFCVGANVQVVEEIHGKNEKLTMGGMDIQPWTHMSGMVWGSMQLSNIGKGM
jgi:hypothetical protein